MGMSASDAAPLPRLGEIFFDVRGSSRSMRLSWYSNTGVAVFSIWQGGTCTGTFRLPMDDLTRLVDSLRRGASGDQADDSSGPIALGGQRPRLAIGPAPAEPFTGMMAALTDERAAGYGRSSGRRTGGFATAGPDQARAAAREPVSLSDYAGSAQAGRRRVDQYGARPAVRRGQLTARASSRAQRRTAYSTGSGTARGPVRRADPQYRTGSAVRQRRAVRRRATQYDASAQYGAQRNGTGR